MKQIRHRRTLHNSAVTARCNPWPFPPQSYKKSAFSKQQLIVTFVSAINVVLLVVVFISTFFDPTAAPPPAAASAAGGGGVAGADGGGGGGEGGGGSDSETLLQHNETLRPSAASRLSRGEVGIFLLQVAISASR